MANMDNILKNDDNFGMTQYLSSIDHGFSCILKHRFQDFLVYEIDENENVVHLTDLGVGNSHCKDASILEQRENKKTHDYDINGLVSQDILPKLGQLNEQSDCLTREICIDCSKMDKNQRTQIHGFIRDNFENLDSVTTNTTVVSDASLDEMTTDDRSLNSSIIKITRKSMGSQNRKRKTWPDNRGDFCSFILYKENKDSALTLQLLQKFIRIKSIGVAGTKDKRAVTCQRATVYRTEIEKLSALNDKLYGIKLGNFTYCQNQLTLGDLKGNRFNIILRNLSEQNDDQLKMFLNRWEQTGFINYYGPQRFGVGSVKTHEIGRSILKGDWSQAVDLILSSQSHLPAFEKCVKTWFESKDPDSSYNNLAINKRDGCIEGLLLKYLRKPQKKNDFCGAIKSLPRNVRNLYVHSFQSLLWNTLISKRIEKFGQKIFNGDFIEKDNEVHCVTENMSFQVKIDDICVPFFANEDQLPNNIEITDLYNEILNEYQVTWQELAQRGKEYALHGGYRKLIVKPKNLKYQIVFCSNLDDVLLETDLDKILNKKLTIKTTGDFKCLNVQFDLPPASYATIALRELCKCDFDPKLQIELSKNFIHQHRQVNAPPSSQPV